MSADGRPWLSILVPARNVAPWVTACLASITRQCDAGVEIVVLDDASRDATARLARHALHRHASARVLENPEPVGVAAARNRLLDEARGEYVWFVDADDVMVHGALNALRRCVEAGPGLVLCDYRVLRDAGPLRRLRGIRRHSTFDGPAAAVSDPRSRAAGLLLSGQLHAWSKIAKRELWRRISFPSQQAFEDIRPSLDLALQAPSALHVRKAWVRYRQRADSVTHALNPAGLLDLLRALDDVRGMTSGMEDEALAFASAYFRARAFAALVRRASSVRSDPGSRIAMDAAAASFARHFPDGIRDVVRGCVRRGHPWRALRLQRTLRSWLG